MEQPLLRLLVYFVILLGQATIATDSHMPIIDVQLSNSRLRVGDNVTFTCNVTSVASKTVTLVKAITLGETFDLDQITSEDTLTELYKNLQRFHLSRQHYGDGLLLMLRITGVQWEDSGNYMCKVSEFSEYKTLAVYRKPTSVFFVNHTANSVVILRENEIPNFTCRVPDVLPIPEVQIFLDRKQISPKSITEDFTMTQERNLLCSGPQSARSCPLHLSYTMVAVNKNFMVTPDHDEKTLTCVATMRDLDQDEMSSAVKLDVRYSPKFVCADIWNATVNMIGFRIICRVCANPPSARENMTVTIDTSDGNFILVRVGDNKIDYSLEDKTLKGTCVKGTQLEFVIKTVSEQHFNYSYNFSAANDVGSTAKMIRIEESHDRHLNI